MMRQDAISRVFSEQLARVGRKHALVVVRSDYTICVSDSDGAWEGPATFAFGVLVICDDGAGIGPEFWKRFR